MSSSSYCQGLQSCPEPGHLVEQRVVRLKLAPPKSKVSRSSTSRKPSFVTGFDYDTKGDSNIGGWSFLQCLANKTCQTFDKETTEKHKVYTPPSFKRYSTLSEKSLEMCTESLGSETGSELGESVVGGPPIALVSLENGNHGTREKMKLLRETRSVNLNRSGSFPPPLTSFSGLKNVQLRPHRNEGRLVLEAVALSPSHANFLAERINGRLRLHLVKGGSSYDSDNEEDQEEAEDEIEEEEQGTCGEKEFEEVAALEREADDDYDVEGEDLHENSGIDGEEMMGKLARPSKCKEGGSGSGTGYKGLLNWVAT